MRILTIIISILFLSIDAHAQDPVFSQWGLNPSSFNPGTIGVFDGGIKAHIGYRDRWHSFAQENEFNVLNVSLDYKLSEEIDNFTIGFASIQDWSGATKLKQTKSYFSAGYIMQLSDARYGGGYSFLSSGVQVGFGFTGFSAGKFWFGNQFDLNDFVINENFDSGENFNPEDLTAVYADINLGVLWFSNSKRGGYHAGFSISHINTPNISLIKDEDVRLDRRITLHGGLNKRFSNEVSIQPSVIFHKQGSLFTAMVGSYYSTSLDYIGESGFSFGTWLRVSNDINGFLIEGLTLAAKFQVNNIEVGAAYDITLSPAGRFNSRVGGFELNLGYIIGKDELANPIKQIPGF